MVKIKDVKNALPEKMWDAHSARGEEWFYGFNRAREEIGEKEFF